MGTRNSLLIKNLYRSLLKASNPFTRGPKAVIYSCLLHRTGHELDKYAYKYFPSSDDDSSDDDDALQSYFSALVKEVICDDTSFGSHRQYLHPHHVEKDRLRNVIRREFRSTNDGFSNSTPHSKPLLDDKQKQRVGWMALRELNKKLNWIERLERDSLHPHPSQEALDVRQLDSLDPGSYLQPGTFLVAHPCMTGYFRKAVICILSHNDETTNLAGKGFLGTYGLVVNRFVSQGRHTFTLQEVLEPLPTNVQEAFGSSLVREGGPVHMAVQMVYSTVLPEDKQHVGGEILYEGPEKTIRFNGSLSVATVLVQNGEMESSDVTFFIGGSTWTPGQLEREIERGCWIPCLAPTDIAYTGTCGHAEGRPKADLWLSMISACGPEYKALGHLVFNDDGEDEFGAPCDESPM